MVSRKGWAIRPGLVTTGKPDIGHTDYPLLPCFWCGERPLVENMGSEECSDSVVRTFYAMSCCVQGPSTPDPDDYDGPVGIGAAEEWNDVDLKSIREVYDSVRPK